MFVRSRPVFAPLLEQNKTSECLKTTQESDSPCTQLGDWGGAKPWRFKKGGVILRRDRLWVSFQEWGCPEELHTESQRFDRPCWAGGRLPGRGSVCGAANDSCFPFQPGSRRMEARTWGWPLLPNVNTRVDFTCSSGPCMDSRGGSTKTLDHPLLWHSFLQAPRLGLVSLWRQTRDAISALKMPCTLVRETAPGP